MTSDRCNLCDVKRRECDVVSGLSVRKDNRALDEITKLRDYRETFRAPDIGLWEMNLGAGPLWREFYGALAMSVPPARYAGGYKAMKNAMTLHAHAFGMQQAGARLSLLLSNIGGAHL